MDSPSPVKEFKTEGSSPRVYSVPPHLLGRNMDNPIEDMIISGRRIQKPRLGVRVPCRNLTSQIVTQDEIAQELYERSLKRGTVHNRPEGADLFFTKKLTHRLAKKINPSTDSEPLSGKSADKPYLPTNTDKCRIPVVDAKQADPAPSGFKLDPIREREIALKQLMELPTNKRRKRTTTDDPKSKQQRQSNGVSQNQVNKTPANQKAMTTKSELSEEKINNNNNVIQQEQTSSQIAETIEIAGSVIQVTRNFKSPRRTYSLRKSLPLESNIKKENESEKEVAKEKIKEKAKDKIKESPKEKNKDKKENRKAKLVTKSSREINNLLGDEGAIKLLFDVETAGSSTKVKPKSFRTVDGRLKDLVLKTRLVKNAVMRLSSSPKARPIKRRSAAPAVPLSYSDIKRRRLSRDVSSPQPPMTPTSPPSSPQEYTYRLGASRIIRRHSSSSSFSSRSGSPTVTKRSDLNSANGTDNDKGSSRYDQLVGNGPKSDLKDGNTNELNLEVESMPCVQQPPPKPLKKARKPGVPIFVRKPATAYKGGRVRRGDTPNSTGSRISEDESASSNQAKNLSKKKMTIATKNKLKAQMSKNFQKGFYKPEANVNGKGTKSRKASKDSETSTEMPPPAVASTSTDQPNANSSGSTSKKGFVIPSSPNASSYSSLVKSLESTDTNKAKAERSSGRQTNFKELNVRKYDHLVQIILSPSSTKMKGAFNVGVMREFREALFQAKKDDTCRAVLVTSSAGTNVWCQGIDLPALIQTQAERRKAVAMEFAQGIKELARALATFPKPLIAGVNGPTMGLGVTLLPLFDMVFASDKATFYTPYARLGQAPEGGAVLTLPTLFGNSLTMELLMASRRITANEALKHGLVTRVLWPDKFLEELLPSAKAIAANSAQSLEATKALVRHGIRAKLDAALDSEGSLLVQHWTGSECQSAIRQFLDEEEDLGLQKQRVDVT